jgi:curli biogenesis system outer membrane secretion channel CsgG
MNENTSAKFRLFISGFILIASPGFFLPEPSTAQARFETTHSKVLAVLDFEQEGYLKGEKIGGFAADELTTALFVGRSHKVADRSLVRMKEQETGFTQAAVAVQDVRDLAAALGADFLVFGKITDLNAADADPQGTGKTTMEVTIRVLDARNAEVVGMAVKRVSKKGPVREIVRDMIYRMSESIRLE